MSALIDKRRRSMLARSSRKDKACSSSGASLLLLRWSNRGSGNLSETDSEDSLKYAEKQPQTYVFARLLRCDMYSLWYIIVVSTVLNMGLGRTQNSGYLFFGRLHGFPLILILILIASLFCHTTMVNGKSRSRITTLAAFKASGLWFGFRFSPRKHLVVIFLP